MFLIIAIGLTLLATLLGIDIYLATDGIPGDTWSEILRAWGKQTPFVPWAWSVLLGHWFHSDTLNKPIFNQPASVIVLVVLTFVIVVGGMVSRHFGFPIKPWEMIIPGVLTGMLLWPV